MSVLENVSIGNPPKRLKSPKVTLMGVPRKRKNLEVKERKVLKASDAMSVLDLDMFWLNILTIRGLKTIT
jgi:hypothetical protein